MYLSNIITDEAFYMTLFLFTLIYIYNIYIKYESNFHIIYLFFSYYIELIF